MARGIGATSGVGSTDRIETALTAHSTLRTYSFILNANTITDNDRFIEKRTGGSQVEIIWAYNVPGVAFSYYRAFSTTDGWWRCPTPAVGQDVSVVVTYDSGSVSNKPSIYFDNVLQTLTTVQNPVGTVSTNTDPYVIGNRGAGDRVADGEFSEVGIWDRILSAGEIKALSKWYSPANFPNSLVAHSGLIRSADDSVAGVATVTGTTVVPHPRVIYPSADILQFPSSDTTAPTLTSPTGTKTGSTTATGTVDTNEANGTMYAVADQSGTKPSVAQIQAGQGSDGLAADYSANQVISSTGTKTFLATGLPGATTEYFFFQHKDAAGNDSTVSASTGFTTDAASSGQLMGSIAGTGGLAGMGGIAGNGGGIAG